MVLSSVLSRKRFRVVDIDSDIAAEAAEIKVAQGRGFPLADAIISATAALRRLVCFTDDDHIKAVAGVRTRWIGKRMLTHSSTQLDEVLRIPAHITVAKAVNLVLITEDNRLTRAASKHVKTATSKQIEAE